MSIRPWKIPQRLTMEEFLKPAPHFDITQNVVNQRFPLHWHEFYEMELIREGSGTHIYNGQTYPLVKGVFFLLTPADFHEVIPDTGSTLHLINIKFSDEAIREELRDMLFQDGRYLSALFEGSQFQSLERELFRLLEEYSCPDFGTGAVIHGGLERVLIDFIRKGRFQGLERPEGTARQFRGNLGDHTDFHSPLQQALIHLHHHFREPLKLEELARMSHLSVQYFSERFHRTTGVSFQNYLQTLRLNFAKSLLAASDLPVTEICYAAGFNSLPYFIRSFKKAFGKSPGTFRRKSIE